MIDQQFKENILAISDYENIGLLPTNGNGFEWRLKPEKWNEFKEKIVTSYSSNDGGHHYLDSDSKDNNDLQVILSFKEQIYDLPFWNQFKT